MPRKSYSYTNEKLTQAVYLLAVGSGDVRERLISAYMEFHTLTENDFPEELKKDWLDINKALTKYPPFIDYKGDVAIGSVGMTMRRIKRKTGVKIAQKIVNLQYKIADLVR